MCRVFQEDPQMRHRVPACQLFVHIRLKGQLLNISVFTNFDKLLPAFIALLPEILHHTQDPEYFAMLLHEHLAAFFQAARITRFQGHVRSTGHGARAIHGVINTLAR